jgi:quercetin dioxygenase-like cupin family protein
MPRPSARATHGSEDAVKSLLGTFAVLASLGAVAADAVKQQSMTIRPADLKWEKPFGPQGMSLAFLIGRLGNKKPASYFIKFPAGYKTGWHTHTNDYEAVVLEGTFTAQEQGEAEQQLPAGSFLMQPGKQNHRNGCAGGEDCLIFIHYQLGADAQPMTADGKPLPPAPAAEKK